VLTTLTLDDDVAALLHRLAEQRREPFERIVNEAMRAGLAAVARAPRAARRPYRLKPVSLGAPRLPNIDDIAYTLAITSSA
jgi:hypothetical protein